MIVSALANPIQFPLRSIDTLQSSSALIVAPHPDDETLGCGGAIALLNQASINVLVISDGTLSHPRSQKYPAPALKELRRQETLAATSVLGVEPQNVTFLEFKDGSIPTIPATGAAVCRSYLSAIAPQLIFVPWRFDPHPDHRATWHLIHTALQQLKLSARLIEYPIWDWDLEQRGEVIPDGKFIGWRLNIESVMETKQQAIAQYKSQITDLIDDDPEGFRLTEEMLQNFSRSWELYFEEQR